MPSQESKPPTRQQRQQCWKVRDEYFACLDRLSIIDPTVVEKDPQKAKECLDCKKLYEDTCLASWVEYFNKRRVLDERQKQYLEFTKQQAPK
ncbi:hypothetical protein K492DRAFT_203122 [Lichtheimia hyalospora FSU 10163]|nr:hypothetical protein K492DRAFT_203122 [Lichtheimia hyalospora FSU 10163]